MQAGAEGGSLKPIPVTSIAPRKMHRNRYATAAGELGKNFEKDLADSTPGNAPAQSRFCGENKVGAAVSPANLAGDGNWGELRHFSSQRWTDTRWQCFCADANRSRKCANRSVRRSARSRRQHVVRKRAWPQPNEGRDSPPCTQNCQDQNGPAACLYFPICIKCLVSSFKTLSV